MEGNNPSDLVKLSPQLSESGEATVTFDFSQRAHCGSLWHTPSARGLVVGGASRTCDTDASDRPVSVTAHF